MFKEYLASHGSVLPYIGTVILFLLFVAVYAYVLTDRRRAHHERMARMALNDQPEDQEPRP